MAEITLHRYSAADAVEWNAFLEKARNGTFLFDRNYMDYHSDRFTDHSLMARKGGKLLALLPADITTLSMRIEDKGAYLRDDRTLSESPDNHEVRVLRSHGGLSYGGWILPCRHLDGADMLGIFTRLREYALDEGIDRLEYKALPSIYDRMPSQEDRYALFREGATLMESGLSCAIDLRDNPGFNTQQKRNLKRALRHRCQISEVTDCRPFHALLSDCLEKRHGLRPVHTADELTLLRNRFPGKIRIFTLTDEEGLQCGVCMYDTGIVAHAQYICATPRGREEGELTLLFSRLYGIFEHCRYFDFGISTEDHGRYLNEGLSRQKYGLGGSGVVYERYSILYDHD